MDLDQTAPPEGGHEALRPGAVGDWLREGARSALLKAPRWPGLQPHPVAMLALALLGTVLAIAVARLTMPGAARFYAPAFVTVWFPTVVVAWVVWLVLPRARGSEGPGAAQLFCLMVSQSLFIGAVVGGAAVAYVQSGATLSFSAWMVMFALGWTWSVFAQWRLLAPLVRGRPRVLGTAVLVLGGIALASPWLQPVRYWYPEVSEASQAASAEGEPHLMKLDQAAMEAQPLLLQQRLSELAAGVPGRVELFSLGFAPYADEEVFRREAEMVSQVMQQRFAAQGHAMLLVNHPDTVRQWPWATPLNLQRTIQAMAARMDRDEDVLFIHLTSHGGRDGHLAAAFFPMTVDEVTPQQLRHWLDEAGVRWRVISVSACYSGSWVAPLSDDHTLVMTAADSAHTSYGCGRGSEYTFFSRAMYDEQLRSSTLDFEKAFAAARPLIDQREQKAGKGDGFSNPQMAVGEGIRAQLRLLREDLERPPRLAMLPPSRSSRHRP